MSSSGLLLSAWNGWHTQHIQSRGGGVVQASLLVATAGGTPQAGTAASAVVDVLGYGNQWPATRRAARLQGKPDSYGTALTYR